MAHVEKVAHEASPDLGGTVRFVWGTVWEGCLVCEVDPIPYPALEMTGVTFRHDEVLKGSDFKG